MYRSAHQPRPRSPLRFVGQTSYLRPSAAQALVYADVHGLRPSQVTAKYPNSLGVMTNMRLPASLNEELHAIARRRGVRYQPMLRQVLADYAAAHVPRGAAPTNEDR